MLQTISRVVAALVILAGCTVHETHMRCRTSADCGVAEQCYLHYCVVVEGEGEGEDDLGDITATQAQTPNLESRDAGRAEAAPELTGCEQASAATALLEGACCAGPATCYDGPDGTLGVGACKAGSRACVDGKLATCIESVLPRSEACDNQGSDDDCDGEVDNIAGRGDSCVLSSGFGPCGDGSRDCADGSLACLRTEPASAIEACNEQDDDCDGQIDEGFDISTDRANCGTCGEICADTELCCAGICLATTSASASGCPACGSQQPCADADSCCGGACRDLKRDRRHCGACGHSCEQAERCCGGACKTSCN